MTPRYMVLDARSRVSPTPAPTKDMSLVASGSWSVSTPNTVTATLTEGGVPQSGVTVSLVSSSANGVVDSSPVVTDGSGEAIFTVTPDSDGGSFTLTASASGYPDATLEVDVAAPGATLVFDEDWSSYLSSADLASEPRHAVEVGGDGEINLVTGLTGTPWGGTNAVQRRWPTGGGPNVPGSGSSTVGMRVVIPNADTLQLSEMWVELYVDFRGYTRPTTGFVGDKALFFQDQEFDRWDPIQGVFADYATVMGTGDNAGAGTLIYWARNYPQGDIVNAFDDFINAPGWVRLRFHARMGRGTADGVFTAWLDDDIVMDDQRGIVTNEAGDYFRYIQIGANTDANPGAFQNFGRLRVYTSNPGW